MFFYFQYLYLYDVIGNGKAMEELYAGHIYTSFKCTSDFIYLKNVIK
ncbi:hypothetical protein BACINT_03466 [Bacteroides intestinalis DSM 17393]|uniref:Uncharacterized protein n=1 Tax=Bacteroides intestinalis DSM 17393 TaxID=471870 RepID=B3CB80_9BACE|nr:hypothetical protein BACINT_03466 [Bacteroides intestinalis DSM 17393]